MHFSLRNMVEKLLLSIWFPTTGDRSPNGLLSALLGNLLVPLSWLTIPISRHRRNQISHLVRSDVAPGPRRPVILVVGNLVAGGAGKTPASLAIARHLRDSGYKVGLLCNAYRATTDAAQMVNAGSAVSLVGDEALLLALGSGLAVASGRRRDQALGVLLAHDPAIEVVVADDGLQHSPLPRHLELAVFDARGAGNQRLLPAGPLREPLAHAQQMSAVLLNATRLTPIAHDRVFHFSVRAAALCSLQQFAANLAQGEHAGGDDRLEATLRELRKVPIARRQAIAGIAQPQRFADTLAGLDLPCPMRALGDHARLDAAMIRAIDADIIIMTAKDAVKLLHLQDQRCWVLLVEAQFDAPFYTWLDTQIKPLLEGSKHG
jgi:tetraacyldisaccharide 4'-kinase